MNLVEQSYHELNPKGTFQGEIKLFYSGKFRGYNANIRLTSGRITVSLSKRWKGVSPDIQKGCIQELLVRLFKIKKHTIHIDLYNNFIKNMSHVAPRIITDPTLERSFQRVNEKMFSGLMVQTNLTWSNGTNKLGSYEYAMDTITISKILLDDTELLDYVMYHEMLHKKHQYTTKKGRSRHHTKAFREDEKKFPEAERLEKELERIVTRRRRTIRWTRK